VFRNSGYDLIKFLLIAGKNNNRAEEQNT